MRFNFGSLFQKFSKDLTMDGLVRIPKDRKLWPDSWRKTEFKNYGGHFRSIPLPLPSLSIPYEEVVTSRISIREWGDTPLSLANISNLLFYSCGTVRKALDPTLSHRVQASGGRRYPLEVYVVNLKKGELDRRIYHYDPEGHALHELWTLDIFEKGDIDNLGGQTGSENAAAIVLVTAVVDRSLRKYGERGYRYMYLEAGAIANTLNGIGSTEGMGSVILGGVNDLIVEKILDIDGETETVLVGFCVGNRV